MILVLGALSGLLAVALGAFGAHALAGRLGPERHATFQTGVQYQMAHSLAALVAGGLAEAKIASATALWGGAAFLVGIVLFSGSLYALTLSGRKSLGAITPIGGLFFLAGWVLLALGLIEGAR